MKLYLNSASDFSVEFVAIATNAEGDDILPVECIGRRGNDLVLFPEY